MDDSFDSDGSFEVKAPSGQIKSDLAKVGQEQIHGLLFGEQLSWQSIIYDLINTEQLDPWDIDLVVLANKYLERIRGLEESNLFVSSKVLFAAALLLRIKTEILLNQYIPSLDAILFGEKEEKKYFQERLELDEEIPELVPRTPLPRFRKVTLQELMEALGKAVKTENRRIQRVVTSRQQEFETAISLPKRTINIKDKIQEIYSKVKSVFSTKKDKISFSELAREHHKGDRIGAFVPLLHLDFQHKVLLEQEKYLDEIWVWLKSHHEEVHSEELKLLKEEVDRFMREEYEIYKQEAMEKGEEFQREEEFEDDDD